MAIVTLLSDFGTRDGYAAAMKGVVLARAPEARVLDLTHDIPPQDVRAGAWALLQAAPCFPEGTIHVAVVDPGVGGARRPLLLAGRGQLFVGPDNGLLAPAAGDGAAGVVLDREELFRRPVSVTFHGRDIFAAVAGHLAAGVSPEACGGAAGDWARLPWPPPREVSAGRIAGEVVHVDRFGNLITSIPAGHLEASGRWAAVGLPGGRRAPLRRTYADVGPGEIVAYAGSAGLVEIAARDESAAAITGLGRGAPVELREEVPA